ncbi:MAG: hypothetical protein SOW32_13490 [Agathobacter sp.]|nr:hypothetical protein [Agathobacter sp.]
MIETINFRRIMTFLCVVASAILYTCFLGYYEKMYADDWYCMFLLDAIFLLILIFELHFARSKSQLAENRNSYFVKFAIAFFVCCICGMIFVFLPLFARPVVIIPIIIFSVTNEMIAIICSCYFTILLSLTVSGDYYELLSHILVSVIGIIITQVIFVKKLQLFAYTILLCINTMIPIIFYYWEYREYSLKCVFFGCLCGLVSVSAAFICDKVVKPYADNEVNHYLLDMISEDYHLVKEIKNDSSNEYEHAKKVSEIAYECAKRVGIDANLCAASGFYYRLGKWMGEPHVISGIKKAQEMCFPAEVIYILSEYYGEDKLPSSPESALVHMVDALVKKMETLEGEFGKSKWNNEMLIYQTMNEFSSSGLYDKSGLGMNHFLNIREYLAKESMLV